MTARRALPPDRLTSTGLDRPARTNGQEIIMATKKTIAKTRPTHRISFCTRLGLDAEGVERLGPPREVGAVWPRRNGKQGGVIRFDHTPRESGVYFIVPLADDMAEAAQ
jgi:hypothetical protein